MTNKGLLKKDDNVIAARYVDGTKRVICVPTPASETQVAMEQTIESPIIGKENDFLKFQLILV